MQAIARVNRVFKDKQGGLMVDYIGIANELRSALKEYTASQGRGRPTVDAAEECARQAEADGQAYPAQVQISAGSAGRSGAADTATGSGSGRGVELIFAQRQNIYRLGVKNMKIEAISIKRTDWLNEKWVQDAIADDPTILGLGDLILKDKEEYSPMPGDVTFCCKILKY